MGQEEVAKAILTWAQKKMEDDDSTEKDIWKDAMRGIHNRSRKSLGFARMWGRLEKHQRFLVLRDAEKEIWTAGYYINNVYICFFPSLSDYQAWFPSSFPTPGVVWGWNFCFPKKPREMMERFLALKSGWNDGMFQRCLGNQEITFFRNCRNCQRFHNTEGKDETCFNANTKIVQANTVWLWIYIMYHYVHM